MDNGLTFANIFLKCLANLLRSSNEFTTALVGGKWHLEHASKEVLRHLCALVLDHRVMDKRSTTFLQFSGFQIHLKNFIHLTSNNFI